MRHYAIGESRVAGDQFYAVQGEADNLAELEMAQLLSVPTHEWTLRKQPTPGAMNAAFSAPARIAMTTIQGGGTIAGTLNVLQPQQVFQPLEATQTGFGGIQHGTLYLQGLAGDVDYLGDF